MKRTSWFPPLDPGSQIEISDHVEAYIGKIAMVFHEKVSPLVHIDVLHVAPTADSPYHSLITCGMSDAPMHVPDTPGQDSPPRHMELMITLPEDWRVSMDAFESEQWYWPLRLLKQMARLPHERRTWLGRGHTVPCAEPFGADSPMVAPFSGVLIMPSPAVPEEFLNLSISEEKNIVFYSLIPLYEEEMQLKIDRGLDALLELFVEHEVDDLVEVGRGKRRVVARLRLHRHGRFSTHPRRTARAHPAGQARSGEGTGAHRARLSCRSADTAGAAGVDAGHELAGRARNPAFHQQHR